MSNKGIIFGFKMESWKTPVKNSWIYGLRVDTVTLPGQYESLRDITSHYGTLRVIMDHYELLRVIPIHYWSLRVIADHYELLRIITNYYGSLRIITDHYELSRFITGNLRIVLA